MDNPKVLLPEELERLRTAPYQTVELGATEVCGRQMVEAVPVERLIATIDTLNSRVSGLVIKAGNAQIERDTLRDLLIESIGGEFCLSLLKTQHPHERGCPPNCLNCRIVKALSPERSLGK